LRIGNATVCRTKISLFFSQVELRCPWKCHNFDGLPEIGPMRVDSLNRRDLAIWRPRFVTIKVAPFATSSSRPRHLALNSLASKVVCFGPPPREAQRPWAFSKSPGRRWRRSTARSQTSNRDWPENALPPRSPPVCPCGAWGCGRSCNRSAPA